MGRSTPRDGWIELVTWLPRSLRRLAQATGAGRVMAVLLLAAVVGLRVWDPAPVELLRLKTLDVFQQLKPRTIDSNVVVVVDIDERSLREIGQWPWPRTIIARLVEQIGAANPAAIGFDIVFAEPDRMSPRLLVEGLTSLDPSAKDALARLPDNETALATAMRGTRVVLGQAGSHAVTERPAVEFKSAPFAFIGGDPSRFLFRTSGIIANQATLEDAAVGRGLVSIPVDRDGIIRRVPTVMLSGERKIASLAIEMLRVGTGTSTILMKSDAAGIKSLVVAGAEVPTDRQGQIWVYFQQYSGARMISAADVFAGRIDRQRINGKLVLVGTSAAGLFDLRSTPLDGVRPGVDIHAEIIDNILTRSYLTRPHTADGIEIVLVLAVGLLMIALVPLIGATSTMALGLLVAFAMLGSAWYLFETTRTLIDVIYPLLSSLAVFIVLILANYLTEERRRHQIRAAFSQYLSPELVSQLTREPDRLRLGGETRELTILFSDVRGFTTIAEGYKADPGGLTQLMNRLLTPLSNAITQRLGTIDKYMGDAIMAFWNAPLDDQAHARNACRSALVMLDEMQTLNADRDREAAAQGQQALRLDVGIGIATGVAIVGNMGSDLRFDYSVLGDSVNLASRLEGLTRIYGCHIIIAEGTAAQGAFDLATILLDSVKVKGRAEPESIHVLVGDQAVAARPDFLELRGAFAAMRTHYLARRWDEARASAVAMEPAADRYGLTGALTVYCDRIESLKRQSPPDDWDGIHSWDSK